LGEIFWAEATGQSAAAKSACASFDGNSRKRSAGKHSERARSACKDFRGDCAGVLATADSQERTIVVENALYRVNFPIAAR